MGFSCRNISPSNRENAQNCSKCLHRETEIGRTQQKPAVSFANGLANRCVQRGKIAFARSLSPCIVPAALRLALPQLSAHCLNQSLYSSGQCASIFSLVLTH